jgi:hypothetical protein
MHYITSGILTTWYIRVHTLMYTVHGLMSNAIVRTMYTYGTSAHVQNSKCNTRIYMVYTCPSIYRAYKCMYMVYTCMYMYIEPCTTLRMYIHVYTMYIHVYTSHVQIWRVCQGIYSDVPCADRYIHFLKMYRLLAAEYIHRCTILISAFFVLPGWLAGL